MFSSFAQNSSYQDKPKEKLIKPQLLEGAIKENCNNSIITSKSNNPIHKFKCGACFEDHIMSKNKIEVMECGCTYCFDCLLHRLR
jgi:late competence protein required for DNA uptake (superfamily II DNA/RNA helicase)